MSAATDFMDIEYMIKYLLGTLVQGRQTQTNSITLIFRSFLPTPSSPENLRYKVEYNILFHCFTEELAPSLDVRVRD